jgi:hypothetical protein
LCPGQEQGGMRGSSLVGLLFLCCVTAVPDRAELRALSGCSLRDFPKLSEAVLQPELNRFKNFAVFFDRDDAMYLRLLEENREVERVPVTEDMGVEEILALLKTRGLTLIPNDAFVAEIKDGAALAQFEWGGDRLVVFQVSALRAVAAKHAEKVKGELATFEDPEKQKAVSVWLKNFPQVKAVHTGTSILLLSSYSRLISFLRRVFRRCNVLLESKRQSAVVARSGQISVGQGRASVWERLRRARGRAAARTSVQFGGACAGAVDAAADGQAEAD